MLCTRFLPDFVTKKKIKLTNNDVIGLTCFLGNANPPAFGTTPTSSFGASSSFTSQSQQFMGATAPAGGVFTIGSGSTPGSRPRAQIRAKRRT